jgi:O-antigen ligase
LRAAAKLRYSFRAWLARTDALEPILAVAPGVLIAAVLVAFAASEGGYLPVTWYPGLVFCLLLLAAIVAGRLPALAATPRIVLVALGLGAAFVLWSYASIAWADVQGIAWDAANRSLLYFALFAIFCLWPWRSWAAAATLGVFGVGVAVVGVIVVLKASGAPDPLTYLIKDRFAEPVGYPNGNAALFLAAAWPLAFLASRPEPPWPLRGVTLGAAGVLVQLAVLGQSRGAIFAGVLSLALFFVLVPGRGRSLVAIVAIAAAALWGLDAHLDIFTASKEGGDVGEALARSVDAMVASFVVLAVVGSLWGLVERYVEFSPALRQAAGRGGAAVVVLAGVGAVVAGLIAVGNPATEVEKRWDEFTQGQPKEFGTSRFESGLGSYRSEYWDVALAELGERPVTGMGAGNFGVAYARERRRASEEPLYAHSFPVELASQTGIVGTLLFTGFIAAALAAAWRARHFSPLRRGLAGVAVVSFAYWFLHAAGDWLWALPALAGAAFAWLGLATSLGASHSAAREEPADHHRGYSYSSAFGARWQGPALAGLAVLTLAGLAAAVPPWLAAVEVEGARDGWRTNPARAFDRLDRARELNPLSDQPDLVAAAIAVELDNPDRARRAFADAAERSPEAWFPQQQLGLELGVAGETDSALRHLERARRLNPLEETTTEMIDQLRANETPSAEEVRRQLAAKVCLPVPAVAAC